MTVKKNDRQSRRVRAAIRRDQLRGRFRNRAGRTATYMLGAALGIGGAPDLLDRIAPLSVRSAEQAALPATPEPRVSADDSAAGRGATRVSIHPLIRPEWFPPYPAAPLEQEEPKLIGEQVRQAFFRTSVPYGGLIHEKARKYDVDPLLVAAVVEAESSFRPRAVSPAGARGLMQLMPRTGRWMGAKNLSDPAQNLDAGVKYLKYLERRFDGNRELQIAAYNGGEGNVRKYRGVPPFRETRTYVRKVMKNYDQQKTRMEQYGQRMDPDSAR